MRRGTLILHLYLAAVSPVVLANVVARHCYRDHHQTRSKPVLAGYGQTNLRPSFGLGFLCAVRVCVMAPHSLIFARCGCAASRVEAGGSETG